MIFNAKRSTEKSKTSKIPKTKGYLLFQKKSKIFGSIHNLQKFFQNLLVNIFVLKCALLRIAYPKYYRRHYSCSYFHFVILQFLVNSLAFSINICSRTTFWKMQKAFYTTHWSWGIRNSEDSCSVCSFKCLACR